MTNDATNPLEEIAKAAAKKRPIFTFKVPPKLAELVNCQSVGLVELTPREQKMASTRGGLDPMVIASEYCKEALREVNGKPVSSGDASVDKFWERAHPKLRALITTAYDSLHSVTNEDTKDFLETREVSVR